MASINPSATSLTVSPIPENTLFNNPITPTTRAIFAITGANATAKIAPTPMITGTSTVPKTFPTTENAPMTISMMGFKTSNPSAIASTTNPKVVKIGDKTLPTISTTYPITSNITLNAGTTNC